MRAVEFSVVLFLLLALAGCGLGAGDRGPGELRLKLEEARQDAQLLPGEILVLDVRNSGAGGYQFSGASFDPTLLRLDKFWTEPPADPKPGDFGRAFYAFTALRPGACVVEIRIKRPWEKDSAPEIYRSVSVSVGAAEASDSGAAKR